MTIFELLFVCLFFGSLIALISALIVLVRGPRHTAKRLLRALGAVWAVYLFVVLLASAATPQRVIPMGQDLCFDEMCFSVVHIHAVSQLGLGSDPVKANGMFYVVTVRVSSHSLGRPQSEGGLRALLWDSARYYGVSSEGQRAWETANGETPGLTARLQPGESVLSVQVLDGPREPSTLGLVLSHGFTPGYFVIGECPILHKPTILRINP